MSGFARHLDNSKFNFDTSEFERERDTSRPIFYMKSVFNKDKDALDEVEYVKITAPGEILNVFGGPVREVDRMRWPEQYERFKKGEQGTDGTPLAKWPEVAMDIDFIDQMRAFRILTVEDMAKMGDSALRLFHGSLEYRKKAQVWLQKQAKEAGEADSSDKDRRIQELEDQMRAMMEKMSAAAASVEAEPVKRRPGRPVRAVQASPTA